MYRPIRDYNIESRAHKVISKDKPTPAPKHQINQKHYAQLLKEHPNPEVEALKDETLYKRLRDVYVTSQDVTPISPISSNKPLPLVRKNIDEPEFGYHEPKRISLGRVTLKSAVEFISQHHLNAREHSISTISDKYKLPEETVKNIIEYFKVYEVYIPSEKKSKTNFFGPTVPRKQIITVSKKQITSGSSET
ncbi:hypothetical protein FQA39_LY17020 [Lamprigera yunnana]|nr:hypothetical protein FQA39_LY17020 [Lamprigera yunnana]